MAAPARAPRARARRPGASAAAGFVIGALAVVAGVLSAPVGLGTGPTSDAARAAAQAAAVRVALDARARPAAAPNTAPQTFAASPAPFSNQMATRIVVRSVGIDAQVRPVGYVYQNGRLEYDVPRLEAGEYVTTPPVGRTGNAVISGHISRRGTPGVFAKLHAVAAGDVVEVYRGDRVFRYSITEIRIVAPDATSVMSQTQDATLTLITCFPDDALRERLVVVGKLM